MAVMFDGVDGPVTSIVNYFSAGSVNPVSLPAATTTNLKETLSGAVTGGVFVTILNVSGRGRVNWVGAKVKDVTLRTISLKVTIDGTVVFNATSNSTTTLDAGMVAVGTIGGIFQPVVFNSSLKIEITQNLSETDKISALYNYEVWA